jgi:hypothetical protein
VPLLLRSRMIAEADTLSFQSPQKCLPSPLAWCRVALRCCNPEGGGETAWDTEPKLVGEVHCRDALHDRVTFRSDLRDLHTAVRDAKGPRLSGNYRAKLLAVTPGQTIDYRPQRAATVRTFEATERTFCNNSCCSLGSRDLAFFQQAVHLV